LTGKLTGDLLMAGLRRYGAGLMTGVPCSLLTPVINAAIGDPQVSYVGATSEGEAVGIACGHWLVGGSPVVLAQNSGLGNMVNPLTSLAWPSRIPVLLLCTWRGQPGLADEPQHELMGRIMPMLLDLLEVGSVLLPKDPDTLDGCLDAAYTVMRESQRPYCLVAASGTVADCPLIEPPPRRLPPGRRGGSRLPRPASARATVLEWLVDLLPDSAAIVATTGKTGRELFTIADRPQHFYLVGAMGAASAVGLGMALGTARPVVVLDGDGAALMRLGNFATIGAQSPANLVHILLDNGVHDSTGGQRTNAGTVDFLDIALACGYRSAAACAARAELEDAVVAALETPGPHLIRVPIQPGSLANLGRPTVSPDQVARRFRQWAGTSVQPGRAQPPPGFGERERPRRRTSYAAQGVTS
jgi:phosphonopyruvate decarboxylase